MQPLSDSLRYIVQDLRDQEKLCVEKYSKYEEYAKDPELKNLFNKIHGSEQQHYESLSSLLNGTCPTVNSQKESEGEKYNPKATYTGNFNQQDKENDKFLCTDQIATEKYVSSAYNFDLYQFGDTNVRKLLNDIETEEQNHAEMIYKYKSVNNMTN